MRRRVATTVTGDYKKLEMISKPWMEKYARRCDAEFVVNRQCTDGRHSFFSKFDVIESACAAGVTHLLYLDIDVLPAPWAPNIFEIEYAGMAHDSGAFGGAIPDIMWIHNELDPSFPANKYGNAGVFLLQQSHLEQMVVDLKQNPPKVGVYGDQGYMNVLFYRMGLHETMLDRAWNQNTGVEIESPQDCYFLHFNVGLGSVDAKYKAMNLWGARFRAYEIAQNDGAMSESTQKLANYPAREQKTRI